MGAVIACLDEAQVLELVEGQLAGEELARAERHMASCEECRQLVSELAKAAASSAAPSVRGDDDTALAPTRLSEQPAASPRISIPIAPVQRGDVLAGKYEVERVLGAGGMGVVVAAKHLQLGQTVALKFLLPAAVESPGAVARFLREGRAAVRIQSEHVARVTDVGTLDNGSPYMVMEFLRGVDFAELLRTRGALPVDEAVDYVLQACEAIAEAHALGMVHRDLKPANVFLTTRADGSPLVKVLDFGISKVKGGGSVPTLTSGEVMMGSPRYMAPEQMTSPRDVDARADVWAVGVLLHELVSGGAPFDADSMVGLSAMILTEPAPPLRKLRSDVPAELEAVVLACLEKNRNKRPQSIADVADALAPLASASGRVSVERIARVVRGSLGAIALRPSFSPAAADVPVRSWAPRRHEAVRTWATVVAGAVVVALVVSLAVRGRTAAERAQVVLAAEPPPVVVQTTAEVPVPALVPVTAVTSPTTSTSTASPSPSPTPAISTATSIGSASPARRAARVTASTGVDTNRAALLDRR